MIGELLWWRDLMYHLRYPACAIAAAIVLGTICSTLVADDAIRTARIRRGDMDVIVRASGTMEPRRVMEVSAGVPGRVVELGPDPRAATDPKFKGQTIDFATPVEAGDLLGRLDDVPYIDAVDRSKAAVARAQAQLDESDAKLDLANLQAVREHGNADSAQREATEAGKRVAQASVVVARARLAEAKVVLSGAQHQLDRTRIICPMAGIVIDRPDPGQTVISENRPSYLFLIGDVNPLNVWANVNGADLPKIHTGQMAHFTCDAFPGREFEAKVIQVRLNAVMTKDQVTYTVVLSVETPDAPLLPYLTTQVNIDCDHRGNVLLVPNAAFGWRPDPLRIRPAPDRPTPRGARQVWVRDGTLFRAVEIQTGAMIGNATEITAGNLKEGDEVVVGGSEGPHP